MRCPTHKYLKEGSIALDWHPSNQFLPGGVQVSLRAKNWQSERQEDTGS